MQKPAHGERAAAVPAERCSMLRFVSPRYWRTWLLLAWMRLAALAPVGVTLRMHKALGRLAGVLFASRARVARRNLELCFPERSPEEIDALLRLHFEALGAGLGETALAWFAPREKLLGALEIDGREHVLAALAKGKGVLLYTGHFTSLEVTGPLLAEHVPRFTFMFSRRSNALLDEIQRRRRSRVAHASFPSDDVRGLISSLKQNNVVWYAADQYYGGPRAELVRFFHEPAMTNTAITRIARITGAAVVPFFYRRRPEDVWSLSFQPPVEDFPGEDPRRDVRGLVKKLEQAIRRAPEQYMWGHKRFKNRPAPLPDVYTAPAAPALDPMPARALASDGRTVRSPFHMMRGAGDGALRTLRLRIASTLVGLAHGLCIGAAGLVPGMSGGSAALVLGVYQRLLRAISRLDGRWLQLLLQRRFAEALQRLDLLFVAPIALGILCAPLLFSRALPLHVLVAEMPEMTYGLIFGSIAASIVSLLVGVGEKRFAPYAWLLAGVTLGCTAVLFVPASTPPDSLWFPFLGGLLLVVVMMMPGLSGAIVLVLLGEQAASLGALTRFGIEVMVPLAAGALAGALLFSRLMTWLLDRYRVQTMLTMVGMLGGSLLALWPFREWVYTDIDGRMTLVSAAPYLPQTLDRGVLLGVGMMLIGAAVYGVLERALRRARWASVQQV